MLHLPETPPKKSPPPIAKEIKDKLVDTFGNNLLTVLLYGSSQWKTDYWDLDVLVVLKQNDFKLTDLNALKIVAHEFKGQSLDLQLMYESEVNSPDTFSLDAHGAFFSRIVSRATVLYGTNPFKGFVPLRKVLLISLITRIQRYVFHARQEYILGGRYNKDRNPKYHQKHVIRSMFDVLLMSREWLETGEVKDLFIKHFPHALSSADWLALESGGDDIADYMVLYEKVYATAVEEAARLISESSYA